MSSIHSTAIVSSESRLHKSVEVGPFSIIEDGVILGEGCQVDAHAKICRGVTMGKENTIGYGAVIGGNPQDLSFDPQTKSGVTIGDQNRFLEYVTIHRSTQVSGNTIVGNRNFMMGASHLAHDVIIGDDNVFANHAMVAGHVHIGNRIFMGGGAGYHQFIRVGDCSIIQGNGGATRDVPPYCIVHGINQLSGLNAIGLKRAHFTIEERKEIKKVYQTFFQKKYSLTEALAILDQEQWSKPALTFIQAMREPSSKGALTR